MNAPPAPTLANFAKYILPGWGAITLVFVAGSLGALPRAADSFVLPWDKLNHFLAFAFLYPFALRAEELLRPSQSGLHRGVRALLRVMIIGGVLELYQYALPHRTAELGDWVADSLGALASAVVILLMVRVRARRVGAV